MMTTTRNECRRHPLLQLLNPRRMRREPLVPLLQLLLLVGCIFLMHLRQEQRSAAHIKACARSQQQPHVIGFSFQSTALHSAHHRVQWLHAAHHQSKHEESYAADLIRRVVEQRVRHLVPQNHRRLDIIRNIPLRYHCMMHAYRRWSYLIFINFELLFEK